MGGNQFLAPDPSFFIFIIISLVLHLFVLDDCWELPPHWILYHVTISFIYEFAGLEKKKNYM